jgi:ABC-type glycerol-3-phosphate transport system substrate-binding protein
VDNMSARIASPPFVQAARQMAETARLSEPTAELRLTPAEVRQAFFAGQCGMAITWPSANKAAAKTAESTTPVAFAELPGGAEFYSFQAQAWTKKGAGDDPRASLCAVSGRLAAVTREAHRSRSAFQLLAWLSGDEASRVIGPASQDTTLFAKSQLPAAQRWVGDHVPAQAANQYGDVAQSAFSRAVWMPVLRIPGADAYHAALDDAVEQALADPDNAEQALAAAAKKWDELTQQHDVARQRRAYQRSLGNEF